LCELLSSLQAVLNSKVSDINNDSLPAGPTPPLSSSTHSGRGSWEKVQVAQDLYRSVNQQLHSTVNSLALSFLHLSPETQAISGLALSFIIRHQTSDGRHNAAFTPALRL